MARARRVHEWQDRQASVYSCHVIRHVALDGVMEGALGLGLDVVDTARRLLRSRNGPRLEQGVFSASGRPVASVQGRRITTDGRLTLRSVRPGDVLVLPGLFATRESAVEHLLARDDVREVVALLPRAAAKGAFVAASCSATFLVAAAGLLDGGSATTTWWLMPFFTRRFPHVTLRADRMVVPHGRVLTAGSAFAHADLMLAVVARTTSPAVAELAARYLVLDQRPSQSQYMVLEHLRSFDPALRAIEELVTANLERQLSLAELAHAAGTSPRTLARRVEAAVGLTPLAFVQRLRVAHASHLLETSQVSVEEIAARVGYADPAAFRRVFKRYAGEPPGRRRRSYPSSS